MQNIVGDYSTTIIDIFKDVVTNYEHNLEIIKQTEDSINDINHDHGHDYDDDPFCP